MATKPDNIKTFYSSTHGYVSLVKRSIGFYHDHLIEPANIYTSQPETIVQIDYWRGQLVHNWDVYDNGEHHVFSKGRIVWLNAANFHQVSEHDYLQYTDIEP